MDIFLNKEDIFSKLDKKISELISLRKNEISEELLYGSISDLLPVYEETDLSECEECEIETDETEEELKEAHSYYRVTANGRRIKRMHCPSGNKVAVVNGIKRCVAMTGVERAKKRNAILKGIRSKRAKGNAYTQKLVIKRKRALTKRKALGLGTTHIV